jgi:hypothetical protein
MERPSIQVAWGEEKFVITTLLRKMNEEPYSIISISC